MEDSSEDETCNQSKASSEKEEGEIQAKEQKDEEYDVKPGDNDSSANGGRRGGGGGGRGGRGKRSLAKKLAITGLVGVGVTAVGVIAAPVIATTALGAAGFTASGVAAGSVAAAVQSSFFGGSVLSGSLFALCQSAGATGVISTATTGLIGGTTGLAGAGTTWGISKFFKGRNTPPTPKLLICGSDAGAHVLAGIASSKEGTSVRVLCLGNDVAQQWNSAIRSRNIEVTFPSTETPSRISSKPSLITKSERVALQDIDIVVFMLPSSDHAIYFRALKNYVKPGTVIVGLPGNPRFMSLGRELLCATGRKCTFISFESLPWDCQITEFGTKCEVLSTRESLSGEIKEGDVSPRMEPVTTLQYLLGPRPNLIMQGRNTPPTPKLLICGSDAGAHVLAGIASSKEGTSVRVLCLSNDVAQQWNSAIRSRNIEVTFPSTETPSRISSKPSLITKSERVALQDIDIVVFMLPSSDHAIYFRALKNYVKPGTVIVGLPGNPRFMSLGRELLCATGRKCTFISFESLPWDCQITEFGTKCEVLSTRESLSGEIEEGDVSPRMEPVTTLQYLLGPRPNLTIARNRHL
ncbi:uncharacterized protein [Montipora capricornis]|uniref:uncharacterized protein isoform X3 n=1 Tax=Montipora capricornis TaxID=246305 RepID=UPI0035F15061